MWFLPVLIKFLFLFADGGLSFFAIFRVFLHPILFIVDGINEQMNTIIKYSVIHL